MYSQTLLTALLASVPLVAAHCKIADMTGDAGGNGTGIGIMGGIVPGAGRNKATEPDTTVFKGANAQGCGRTQGGGENVIEAGTRQAMALSGNTLPQITPGGYLKGNIHIVTSDGGGPMKAMLNEDGTGQTWTDLTVTTNIPGNRRGNVRKTQKRDGGGVFARAMDAISATASVIVKRATNINEDHPIRAEIPPSAKCIGNINGIPNTCLVKMINPSNAGPFGGCVPVQMQMPGANANAPTVPAAPAAAAPLSARSVKLEGAARRAGTV